MSAASWRGRVAELRALVDEVAIVDWRHPSWWGFIASAAAIEPLAASGEAGDDGYLSSDAEPRADTFMAWPSPAATPTFVRGQAPTSRPADLVADVADAVVRGHAAASALTRLDGGFPGQPLAVHIGGPRGARARLPVDDLRRVAFVVGDRAVLARLSERGPGADRDLAAALVRLAAGELPAELTPITPRGPAPPAATAVIVGDQPAAAARHLHRAAWTTAGGPWLGVGRAGGLEVASTCHLVVDGYGHACLAARLAEQLGHAGELRLALGHAAAAARRPGPPPALNVRIPDVEPLAVAWRRLDVLPRLPALAHALGRVLHAADPSAPWSPTIQIPVAPGQRDDPSRMRRRPVPALVSVRFAAGVAEAPAVFTARLRAALAREAAGAGLLSRLYRVARAVPVPLAVKRRAVGSATRPWLLAPTVEVLAGRACLSLLRLGPADRPAPPLVAASAPALLPSARDVVGSSVVTVIADDRGATITLSGAGATGTEAAATAFLDRWLEAMSDTDARHDPRAWAERPPERR